MRGIGMLTAALPFPQPFSPNATFIAGLVYAGVESGNGWPAPVKGESLQSYLTRTVGGSWHPSSPDPVQAAVDAVGGAGIDVALDVVTPFAALVGQGDNVQAVKSVVDAGLATDEKNELQGGSGDSGITVTYVPPATGSLLQQLAQLSAQAPDKATIAAAQAEIARLVAKDEALATSSDAYSAALKDAALATSSDAYSAALAAAAAAPASTSTAAATPWTTPAKSETLTIVLATIGVAVAGGVAIYFLKLRRRNPRRRRRSRARR